jgi:hypothetical protein
MTNFEEVGQLRLPFDQGVEAWSEFFFELSRTRAVIGERDYLGVLPTFLTSSF